MIDVINKFPFPKSLFPKGLWFDYVKSVQIRSFFWSVFYHIWTEYGDLRSKYPYSAQIRENTDKKKVFTRSCCSKCSGLRYVCIKMLLFFFIYPIVEDYVLRILIGFSESVTRKSKLLCKDMWVLSNPCKHATNQLDAINSKQFDKNSRKWKMLSETFLNNAYGNSIARIEGTTGTTDTVTVVKKIGTARHINIHLPHTYIHTQISIYLSIYQSIYLSIYLYTHLCGCVYICIYIHIIHIIYR